MEMKDLAYSCGSVVLKKNSDDGYWVCNDFGSVLIGPLDAKAIAIGILLDMKDDLGGKDIKRIEAILSEHSPTSQFALTRLVPCATMLLPIPRTSR